MRTMAKILLINGPNLNLLGEREPEIYGKQTLAEVVEATNKHAQSLGIELLAFQSNSEGDIIDRLHAARHDKVDYILLNPGALTHTSVALRDAVLSINKPMIEIHLSNIFAREEFRRHSYLSDIATAVITGLGANGYLAAVSFVAEKLNIQNK